jgi:PAS domain S-box-containing protein
VDTSVKNTITATRLAIAGEKYDDESLHLAVESCPCGMLMTDDAGTILLINAEIERLFQYRREDLIGQQVEMLVPMRFRARHPQDRHVFISDPDARQSGNGRELLGLRKDGMEIPVEIGLNPIRMQDGRIYTLSAIHDVGERKRAEQTKDESVAMVCHELRTPLTSIAASLGLLAADPAGKLSDSAARLLRIAHDNSRRLARLINDILNIEKIESGNVVFHIERLAVRPLVEQAIEGIQGFADQFAVDVRLDAGSADAVVHADFDRLTQVITNLLSNAVKYSPRGGKVIVTIESVGTKVRVAVRDRGSGIPAAFRSRIFERFARADSADAHKIDGNGLGLSIVKQIVTKLGGNVGFDAAPDEGTIFHVDLPLYDAESEQLDSGARRGAQTK